MACPGVMLETCGSLPAKVGMERGAGGFLRLRRNHMRMLIAFAASLILHIFAGAFLAAFAFPGGASLKRLPGSSDMPFVASIANPGKRDRSAASPHTRIVPGQAARNPNALSAARGAAGNGAASSRYMGLPGLYYPVSELDAIPAIQRDVDLYPPELHRFGHGGGKVVLSLWIDETGRVARAEPASSDLIGIFGEVAARIFMQAHFLPGMKNGLAVKSRVEAVLFYPPREPGQ